jgi:small subunit ribosomal protein S4
MSRYTGPKEKIIRNLKLNLLPGLKNTMIKMKKAGRRRPPKQYKSRLIEKQKLKYYYGLTERQLINYFLKAKQAEGSTADRLLVSLEMRLDNISFRLGLAPSIPAARQLVTHGHILVNDKKVHAPAYVCKPGDTIQIKEILHSNEQKTGSIKKRANHLQQTENGGRVLGLARKQSLPFKINDLRVIEYYSK